MKNKIIPISALALSSFLSPTPAFSAPCEAELNAFKLIEAPHKTSENIPDTLEKDRQRIAALTQDYYIAIHESDWNTPEWRKLAEKLADLRCKRENIIIFKGIKSLGNALKEKQPRMLAVIANPKHIERTFVEMLHRVTREIDADPYGDCIWGIITGDTPANAEKLFTFCGNAQNGILKINNYLASTNFRSPRAHKSYNITDFQAMTCREGLNGKWTDGKIPANEGGAQKRFVEKWTQLLPELIVSSSHATEFNLEMPWSRGAIISGDGKFWALNTHDFRKYIPHMGQLAQKPEEFRRYAQENQFEQVPFPPKDKKCVWIAAGNCLFGHVARSPYSMAITALSHYNAMQVVGYTVPSWYGQGGWGTLGAFYYAPEGTSLSEAWYLNNQFIINRLSRENQQTQHFAGCQYDLSVVALYGDPAFKAYIGSDTTRGPWTIQENEKEIKITANGKQTGPCAYWFNKRRNFSNASLKITDKKIPLSDDNAFFSNDFIWIRELQLNDNETAEIIFD